MEPWSDARVWDAVYDWHWVPPGAASVATDAYRAAVTPGSYALTYVWDFRVDDPSRADERLAELKARILALGGTGAKLQITPRCRPADLADRVGRFGFALKDETEVLVWELKGRDGRPTIPAFERPPGIEVREVVTDDELDAFVGLSHPIFDDPVPAPDIRERFRREARELVGRTGHSGRYLAWVDGAPVGRAGLEVAGPVARFWGTGVLPEHRHRGIYGALVHARCLASVARGAEIALVTARVGTSGPILKRRGFRPVGTIRMFQARWEDPTAPSGGAAGRSA